METPWNGDSSIQRADAEDKTTVAIRDDAYEIRAIQRHVDEDDRTKHTLMDKLNREEMLKAEADDEYYLSSGKIKWIFLDEWMRMDYAWAVKLTNRLLQSRLGKVQTSLTLLSLLHQSGHNISA